LATPRRTRPHFSASHKYTSNGTYSGSLRLTVGSSTLAFPFTVVVGTVLVCPGSPGCPPPTCPTLASDSVFTSFYGKHEQLFEQRGDPPARAAKR